MNVLLDTNVVSEWTRPRPDPAVIRWLHELDEDRAHLSVITLGELREGVDRLEPGRRRSALDEWISHDLPERFTGRIVPVDAAVANRWGVLRAAAARTGRTVPVLDVLIGACAAAHGLAVATRNVREFVALGLPVVDPWGGSVEPPVR